jgi:Ca2+-binding EF-hand superfamily protein
LGGSTPDLVSPEDRAKYISLFQSFGAENNILNGEKARDSFIRSRLPPETLQRIWTLADTRQSGTLNQTEFIIAMHYIERCMKGLGPLPPSLPPAVYASATGRTMYTSPLMRHNTIATPQRLPTSPVFKGAPMPQQTNVVDISPDEYNKYKTFFHQLNVSNLGYISGADAVVFFKHSKLDDADLARIWDLADTNSTGQLTEQEFVFAMYLINRRVAGGEIPATAPQMKMGK